MSEWYRALTLRQDNLLSLQRDLDGDRPDSTDLGPRPHDLSQKPPENILKKWILILGWGSWASSYQGIARVGFTD
jgi:hypothetical protein